MLHEDIIDPLVTDYIDRVTGEGLNYFNASSTTRLNDFVKYLVSVIPDRQFGFYPLRSDQNIGQGNKAFGIGRLASGSPMIFPGAAQWSESGILFGEKTRGGFRIPSYETVGIIDFSGKVEDGFAFRENDFSIFYFLKHQRPGEFSTSLYRGEGGLCPYFICDKSPDWFQVIAPEFSTSRFRPRGTTYIYDEIFGEDKKGLQIDWSQKDTEKYYAPTAISFYDPDKDQAEPRFYCLNLNGNLNNYSMKFIYGKDPNMLSGNFLSPYVVLQDGNSVRYDMPKRFIAGAGATNDSNTVYNKDGLPHIVPGILITKGNYSYIHEEIAQNMAEAIGLVFAIKPLQISGLQDSDVNICSPKIVSLDYYPTPPKIYNKVLQDFASFTARIASILIEDYGKWVVGFISGICSLDAGGIQRCFGAWTARSPIEKAEIRSRLDSGLYITGNQITGTYGNLKLGEFHNNGIVGFVSGYMDVSGNFSGFQSRTVSGHSGFYYTGSYNVFPPYQSFGVQKITGYVSGFFNDNGSFDIFNSTHPYSNSGYFLSGQAATDFTYSLIEKEDISGFQYGFLNNLLNSWEPFDSTNKLSSSGYISNGEFFEFLPKKIIEKSPVTGFRFGFMNGFGEFSGYSTGEGGVSGILLTNDPLSDDPNLRIFFPADSNYVGFDGISEFDPDIGYEYSGFDFFDSSGFVSFNPQNPFFGTGEMTGLIGYKYFVYSSGEFSGANSITGVDEGFGLDFNGFFDGDTYFSGVEFDPLTNSFFNYGTGYLIGKIGTKNVQNFYGDPGFDNRSGFDPLAGYSYTGFSFPEGSGFVGINGNTFGTGYMSGLIGSRNFINYSGIYSGFTGLLDKYNQYLPQVIFPNFEFTRGSGFIGSVPGYGLLTGVISTGDVSGDAAFVVSNISSGLYLTGVQRTGIGISGIDFGPTDFSIGNISGMITGAAYTLAIISGGTFFETGYTGFNSGTDSGYYDIKSGTYMSGHVTGLSYVTGNLSIGSGFLYELETGFRFESGYISANVTGITLTEAISIVLILQNGAAEQASLNPNISGIFYVSSNIDSVLNMETGSVSSSITSIDHYTFLNNDVTGKFETGYYNISGLYRISTAYPAITGENIYYNISGVLLKTGSP